MKLNLPPIQADIRMCPDGVRRIFDPLRGKPVALTPEEWVRQHFVSYLINCLGYDRALMANEAALVQNGIRRRCDTVIYDRHARPAAVVEYKAPAVSLTQRVFDQIVRYNIVLRAPVLIVSNGLRHYCCLTDPDAGSWRFLPSIPVWDALQEIAEGVTR